MKYSCRDKKLSHKGKAIFEEINGQQRKLSEYRKNGPLIKQIK
jgi:hypothetical protein